MPKPVKKKKKFINKKEATTYRLIPGYVNDDDVTTKEIQESNEELEARKEEQRKYGIFYDDSYNYMKHLRSLNEQAALVESFRMEPEFDVKSNASTQPVFVEHVSTDILEDDDIDPDILAALDDAPVVKITEDDLDELAEVDDFLADDFINKAGGPVVTSDKIDEDDREEDYITDDDDDEEDEDIDDPDDDDGSYEESSDTEDRLSSVHHSQGRGNVQDDIAEAQTALILRNFEEGLGFRCSNQISDDEGEMPTPEDYENLKRIMKDDAQKPVSWSEFLDDRSERPQIDTTKYLYEDEEEFEWKEVPVRKPKFDCMSVLSSNSNTRNRPTDLIPPKSEGNRKHKKSEGESQSSMSGISLRQLQTEMRESRRMDKTCTFRPKDETVEEKKARKKAIKDERKDRRQEKKANKEVFAMEREKMKKEAAALSKSVKSIKIC